MPGESVNAELSPTSGKSGFGDLFETKRARGGLFVVAISQIASIIMAPSGTASSHAAGEARCSGVAGEHSGSAVCGAAHADARKPHAQSKAQDGAVVFRRLRGRRVYAGAHVIGLCGGGSRPGR